MIFTDSEKDDIPENFRPVGDFLKEMYDEMTFAQKIEYHWLMAWYHFWYAIEKFAFKMMDML